ncbi:MAG: hypothetical protein EB117_13560 [Betaproteobacteria bacterium]|nr:hypothetical protein [Betaproteobacteria bacterium]
MAWKTLSFRITGDAPIIMHNGSLADPLSKGAMSRVMRTRPIFRDWSAIVEVEYEDSVVNEEQVVRWMSSGGTQVGLCDWRPKFGRFTAEKLDENKARVRRQESVGAA